MDYKELIDELRMVSSWKCSDCYDCNQCVKAATAIETLLAECDAAITMLHGECHACKHNAGWHNIGKCATCKHENAATFMLEGSAVHTEDNWEWCGHKSE